MLEGTDLIIIKHYCSESQQPYQIIRTTNWFESFTGTKNILISLVFLTCFYSILLSPHPQALSVSLQGIVHFQTVISQRNAQHIFGHQYLLHVIWMLKVIKKLFLKIVNLVSFLAFHVKVFFLTSFVGY